MAIFSGLIVSIDAFFIGISLGLQSRCRFLYLVVINFFLLCLCLAGFFIAGRIYDYIPFDTDYIVGIIFILLGIWYILHHFIGDKHENHSSLRTIAIIGLVMSVEAMIITMGITLIFGSNIAIPITVALAHFGYSALTFFLARTKYVKRLPMAWNHIFAGSALMIYGVFALFV
jgi:putative Mn2+ efflux pump MntP